MINTLNVMGCKTLFLQPILNFIAEKVVTLRLVDCAMSKGRDKDLVRLRDEALCRRYYELTEKQRLRFDDALKILSKHEFFISEERIMAVIRKKVGELENIALKAVPKVRMPRLTAKQLELFADDADDLGGETAEHATP